MLRAGVSLPVLMKLLGHKSPNMTLRYVEVSLLDVEHEFQLARQQPRDPVYAALVKDTARSLGMITEFVESHQAALEKAKLTPNMVVIDLDCDAADPITLLRKFSRDRTMDGIPTVGLITNYSSELKKDHWNWGCNVIIPPLIAGSTDGIADSLRSYFKNS